MYLTELEFLQLRNMTLNQSHSCSLSVCEALFTHFVFLQDVCVPLSHLAELISKSKQQLDASSLIWYVYCHVFPSKRKAESYQIVMPMPIYFLCFMMTAP